MNTLYIRFEMIPAVTVNITVLLPEYDCCRFLLNVSKYRTILRHIMNTLYIRFEMLPTVTINITVVYKNMAAVGSF